MTRLRCLKPALAQSNPGGWKPDAVRGSRQARGYGAEWERRREEVLFRDHGMCRRCLATQNLEVDHVVPKSMGGGDNLENLQILCTTCHRQKTSRESGGGGCGS